MKKKERKQLSPQYEVELKSELETMMNRWHGARSKLPDCGIV